MSRKTVDQAPVVPRWYCVTRDGLTTLCANERDARWLAGECDRDFPRHAPHRAVLLGDVAAMVAAERERCVALIETYRVPVGNSRSGEMAAEWTLDALREVRDKIRKPPNVGAKRGGTVLRDDSA